MKLSLPRSGSQCVRALCSIASLVAAHSAGAAQLDFENPDWTVRWDNTVRYNLGIRAQKPDQRIVNTATYDESDSKFGRGDVVTNRLDLLSEFDAVYKSRHGLRISGTAWGDQAYHNTSVKTNPAFNVPGLGSLSASYPNNQYTGYTKRWNRGPSGELLDAFIFAGFDAGEVPIDVRLGQHAIVWGESLFSPVHGVSYSQGPLDMRKLAATPGVEAKEMFLPLAQISAQARITDTFSLAGQYFFDWDATRLPDGGTYLGPLDMLSNGGGTYAINPAAAAAAASQLGLPPGSIAPAMFLGDQRPARKRGDWGAKANWSPDWLDGSLGFYYREYTDKSPQLVIRGFQGGLPVPSALQLNYLSNIKLFGVTLGKQVGPVSLGVDLVYRKNGALLMTQTTPSGSEPRGDTIHGVVNVLGVIPGTALFDSAAYAAELTFSHLRKVNGNGQNYNAVGYGCVTNDKWDGCATRNFLGLALRFEPAWNQVWSGVNLSAPMFVSVGMKGNSQVVFGGYQGNGSYSLGLSAQIYSKHSLTLQYNGFLLKAKYGPNALGQDSVTSVNGFGTTRDRGWVSLTFKTTI